MLVPLASMMLVAAGPADAEERPRIELLALDVEGLDEDTFERALETRLPDRPRIPAGNPDARAGAQWGYVLVRQVDEGWSLALILADGRGYYRSVLAHEGAEPSRLVANTLANLVASVEEDAIVADAEDVVVPDEREPDPVPEPPPEPEPEPPPEPEPAPPPEDEPRAELGIGLEGLAVWGLGPPAPVGFAGAGGALDLSARLPNGLVIGGALGGVSTSTINYRLGRMRASVHVGFGLRRGRFEMVSVAGVRADPWFVRAAEGAASLRAGDQDRNASLVLGGFLGLSPGLLLTPGELRLRLGPTLRVVGASAVGNGGGVARVLQDASDGPRPLFRLGGLELETGLGVTVWLR